MKIGQAIKLGAIHGAIAGGVLICAVFATGNTFGQRCARIFPDIAARQEQCVRALSRGEPIPTTNPNR